MGNYISCALIHSTPHRNSAVKVISSSNGDVQQIDGPVNAAELMLECPNHFVVHSQSLHIGRRFSPLAADEDLEMGNVYVLFPMSRVNSVVTPADMAGLVMRANSELKKSGGASARILPEVSGPSPGQAETLPRLSLEGLEEDASFHQLKRTLTVCRSRKPMLETITEESVCST
ncbi:uncharacterized protein LOC116248631 [Nymphaea colorata]|nr:uncharacterized protein LOC116248631 [Nymphaea colorata]